MWITKWALSNMSGSDRINKLNNSKLDNKSSLWIWILVQIKRLLKWLKKEHLEAHVLETFILVSMVDGIENCGEILMTLKVLIVSIITEIIDVSVNKHNVKCRASSNFGKTKAGVNP